ncbi:MAG: right-handed parallel beta-helix repeat-containing protein [Chloroflexi bacterium]|nr:right-handed parallel beta-helix repeat-containing protein [Chloroflexota bacterium]
MNLSKGDTIYVAGGTYTGTGAAVITITKSITLYGGWNGASSGPVLRDPVAYPTTLDGEGTRRVVYVGNSITVTIEGLTITNGFVTDRGAGLYAQDANLTLRYTTIYSNVADSQTTADTLGGGGYISGGTLQVLSSTLRANGTWCNGCVRTIGGGLYIYGTRAVTIEGSLFEANDAWDGSGLIFDGGWGRQPILIRHTIFRDNGRGISPGSGRGGYGGGASIAWAGARIEDCLFERNRVGNHAGALRFAAGELFLACTVIRDNEAYVAAGMELWDTSPFTITNNIIADNRPGGVNQAGAISFRSNSTGMLQHNTIARNVGTYGGYGIATQSSQPVTLVNTILVSHTVGISVTAGSTVTLEGTLWGSGIWANGADWGGSGTILTGTVNIWGDPAFVDPRGGNYHLRPGSAAIDAGVDAGVTADIDGDPRPVGAAPDIGADEYMAHVYLPMVMKNHP